MFVFAHSKVEFYHFTRFKTMANLCKLQDIFKCLSVIIFIVV